MTLAVRPQIDFLNFSGVREPREELTDNDRSIRVVVSEIQDQYYPLEMRKLIQDLFLAGSWFRVAYAASLGSPIRKHVSQLGRKYERLAKEGSTTAQDFRTACVESVKDHGRAILSVKRRDFNKALKWIQKCSVRAKEKAGMIGKLLSLTKELEEIVQSALDEAFDGSAEAMKKKEELQKKIREAREKQSALEEKIKAYVKEVNEAKTMEANAEQKAEKAEGRSNLMAIGSLLAAVWTGGLSAFPAAFSGGKGDEKILSQALEDFNKQKDGLVEAAVKLAENRELQEQAKKKEDNSEEVSKLEATIKGLEANMDQRKKNVDTSQQSLNRLEEKWAKEAGAHRAEQAKARELKWGAQKAEMEIKAEHAVILTRIKHSGEDQSTLDAVVDTLQLTDSMLHKVGSVFNVIKDFWEGVEKHCNALAAQDISEACAEDFVSRIYESGCSWASLWDVNHFAFLTFSQVKMQMGEILSSLPSSREGCKRVKAEYEVSELAGLRSTPLLEGGRSKEEMR